MSGANMGNMLRRKVLSKLTDWKNRKGKKTCLIVKGVSQFGKTFIIREFGHEFYRLKGE